MMIDGVPDVRAAEGVRPLNLSGKSTQQRGGDRSFAGAGRRHQLVMGRARAQRMVRRPPPRVGDGQRRAASPSFRSVDSSVQDFALRPPVRVLAIVAVALGCQRRPWRNPVHTGRTAVVDTSPPGGPAMTGPMSLSGNAGTSCSRYRCRRRVVEQPPMPMIAATASARCISRPGPNSQASQCISVSHTPWRITLLVMPARSHPSCTVWPNSHWGRRASSSGIIGACPVASTADTSAVSERLSGWIGQPGTQTIGMPALLFQSQPR